jgi:hypothetical protein
MMVLTERQALPIGMLLLMYLIVWFIAMSY